MTHQMIRKGAAPMCNHFFHVVFELLVDFFIDIRESFAGQFS